MLSFECGTTHIHILQLLISCWGLLPMLKVCNSMLALKDIGLVYQHQKDVSIDIER